MFKTYTGFQYLCIDIANSYGKDKDLFEDRIQWVLDNIKDLESLVPTADDQPLFLKAVMALRSSQKGNPTGHLISLDAVCSGTQLMSALTGCIKGATITGMIDPNVRADAYTSLTQEMNNLMVQDSLKEITISRADAKEAMMKGGYGSVAVPKELFGELVGYYEQAFLNIAPGAAELLPEMLSAWDPTKLVNQWTQADGFEVVIPVMDTKSTRIQVDELNGASITVEYKENMPLEFSASLVANAIHSTDALVVRNMIRRCSYNKPQTESVLYVLETLLDAGSEPHEMTDEHIIKYVSLAQRFNWIDPVIISFIDMENINQLPNWYAIRLIKLIKMMLVYPPFDLLTVHDAFRCHPVNGNAVRYWYKEILSEIAESNILSCIMSDILGVKGTYPKLGNIGDLIRQSNYSLC